MLTRERLHELFEIDTDAGILIWRVRSVDMFPSERACKSWNTRFAGAVAGSTNKRGYREIIIDGVLYLRHRLIWLAEFGVMPVMLDHVHGVVQGDGIGNLRQTTQAENVKNAKRQARNKSGCTGVDWYAPSNKWRATIRTDGERVHLGHFDNLEDAIAARKQAERLYGFHQNHGRAA